MLELKNKQKLSQEAHRLASSYSLVRYRNTTYMPVDFETGSSDDPEPERTMWIPMNRETIRRTAAAQFETLFGSDSELSSFDFMVTQHSIQHDEDVDTLLVCTEEGLRMLDPEGNLVEVTGKFIPNTLKPVLNTEQKDKDRVFETLVEWVNDEDEAHSMLRHFATALAPGWSAVKYVLFLGEGRNGKGLLLKMLQQVFGWENCSNVTRQDIATASPVVTELNGKLLNIVFDGMAEYVKDSGAEKTLIAGETYPIRRLYESTPTPVRTNALFVEALNREPKSSDKSMALQKRLVRYHFPNVYPQDHAFERMMLGNASLGAFLSLLIDHYVREDEVAEKLRPSKRALELQLEHMFTNSIGLQFVKYMEEKDPLKSDALIGMETSELVERFKSWRVHENDLSQWAEPDVLALFGSIIETERKSKRVDGKPLKVRVVSAFKEEARAFIDTMKGDSDDEVLAALVED